MIQFIKKKIKAFAIHIVRRSAFTIDRDKSFVVNETMTVDCHCCPNCKQLHVIHEDKYCSNCGIKLKWHYA